KALVLRTIKELEFDRAMGKVSDKDFGEMSTRLRARAARLMRQLDAGAGYRETIEKEIAKRLRGPQGAASRQASSATSAPHQARVIAPGTCQSCQTLNDADARFCKHCGSRIEAAS